MSPYSREAERCWRCTSCGKWSHARRRPTRHERLLLDPTDAELVGHVILRDEPADYDHLNGDTYARHVYVACGPFETWVVAPLLTESRTR